MDSWTVCGGNSFATCASVQLDVSGNTVTMRIWNLSGKAGVLPSSVFTSVGFENVKNLTWASNFVVSNGAGFAANQPTWALTRANSSATGGINVDLSSISKACASGAIDLTVPSWKNPCFGSSGLNDPGLLRISFTVNPGADFTTAKPTFQLASVMANDCTGTSCAVTPEPISMVLLGTGLAGLGGVGALKRRRRGLQVESE